MYARESVENCTTVFRGLRPFNEPAMAEKAKKVAEVFEQMKVSFLRNDGLQQPLFMVRSPKSQVQRNKEQVMSATINSQDGFGRPHPIRVRMGTTELPSMQFLPMGFQW